MGEKGWDVDAESKSSLLSTSFASPRQQIENMNPVNEFLIELALISLATVGYLRYETWRKKGKIAYSNHFEHLTQVYDVMNRTLESTSAKRILILKTSNSGGRPRFGVQLYASVVYEVFQRPFHSIKSDFQKIEIDEVYVTLLSDMARRGKLFIDVKTMNPGMLKNIYDAQNIRAVWIFYIGETIMDFYYASISTDAEGAVELLKEESELDLFISRIRALFKSSQK